MESKTPSWGIEPVPERLRVLGFLDTAALWGSLGVSLLVLVAGTYLVPALSLRDALIAIVVGGVIGNAMLGTAGAIGAQARVPAMVLMRASLGHRGSYAATALNVAQNLGWAIFELIVIGTAAAALSDRVFGFEGKWLWTIVFGVLTAAMALAGPIAVVRGFVRRFALWVVLASLVYLTWWTIDNADLDAFWSQQGGDESLWYGIDLMIALPASWLPLIADYTRFSRDRRTAFAGSAVGYLIPNAWLYALGALLVLTNPAYSDPNATALMTSIAAGGLAAGLALLALTVDETDEAFANVYSTAVSLQNVLPRAPQRLLIGLAATAATVGALVITWAEYETFLFLLGSFFVPLFGVLLADWLFAGRSYTRADVFDAPAYRPLQLAAWLAGFALYQWLHPTGPSWWTDLLEHADPPGTGASLPSFGLSFALASLAAMRYRR
ncbi:MAG TPA: cytosine permease [Gaiellaceae bacterium]|nr:cytosine permease [Gaiellaceae bacterium]